MQGREVIRRSALGLLIALSLAACEGDASAGAISRDKFVAANVAIRALGDTATPERRAEVLREHGVTDRQLRAWVRANAREPEVLAKTWEQIAFKLDSMASPTLPGAAPGTSAPPHSPGGPPPGTVPMGGAPPPPVRDTAHRRPPPIAPSLDRPEGRPPPRRRAVTVQ